MKKVLIIYSIVQLMTTAYGLAVIESIRPMVEAKLREKGYYRNNNSLYTFSNTLKDVALGLIPCFYLGKAISILSDKSSVDKRVDEQIRNKNYISDEDLKNDDVLEEDTTDSIYRGPFELEFEKREKYTARKIDDTIFDHDETPVEYIERVSTKEDDLEVTPFVNDGQKVIPFVVKDKVSKADIAHELAQLSKEGLEEMRDNIDDLIEIKKKRALILEKEAA